MSSQNTWTMSELGRVPLSYVDGVRASALWEGWFGYDRKKHAAMLREAFEPFVLCLPKTAEENLLTDSLAEEELKRFPLFAALTITRS
jgi:hypothetical protein